MIIAGIGSRKTPSNIFNEMIGVGRWAKQNGHIVRSGHASGADFAFELGAQEYCIAYIPYPNFGKNQSDIYKTSATYIVPQWTPEIMATVDKYHPAPHRLKRAGKKLMARNACQVLGGDLSEPADVVICWTPGGKITGGTGQALRIAEDHSVPVINMYHYPTMEQVVEQLNKIQEQ